MFILIITAMLVLAVLALMVVHAANQSRSRLPVYGTVPEFEFIDQDGQRFDSGQLKGKINIVDFIFTRCKGPCPTMAIQMQELYHLYSGSDKVQLISISVEPEHDSPEVLKQYALDLGVEDRRWRFLHADSVSQVAELCEKGFMLAADDLPGGHTTKFIVVDHRGQIRSYHDSFDEEHIKRLKQNVRTLAREIK
jgi:protein SCO1/2